MVLSTTGIHLSCAAAKANSVDIIPVSANASTAARSSDPEMGAHLEAFCPLLPKK